MIRVYSNETLVHLREFAEATPLLYAWVIPLFDEIQSARAKEAGQPLDSDATVEVSMATEKRRAT